MKILDRTKIEKYFIELTVINIGRFNDVIFSFDTFSFHPYEWQYIFFEEFNDQIDEVYNLLYLFDTIGNRREYEN
jgi:hypothetical protein